MPQVMPLARASKPPKGAKVQQPPAAARSARQASRSARQAAPSALVLPAHSKATSPKITSPKLGDKASLKANNCPIRDAGRGR
ncbi:hypothetical protein HMPREF1978_00037 [Actinomyces graevenitzii F0530]|uniref:Uncharacterized protein n=1 Tax=Actinomyces graevenitzii F0530 TaxID=1321817 RepID=U1QEP6_9ACTO|nr:hypothetical protein HMPREF1978_00037 [Actinomyces graevenitzii F0530]